jgi:predicted protein tyrosine phosphatase
MKIEINSKHIIEHRDDLGDKCVISISDNMSQAVKFNKSYPAQLIRLYFHDIESNYFGETLFNEEHAEKILSFALDCIKNNKECIVIHCYADISRSTAVGLFIHAVLLKRSFKDFYIDNPTMLPNKWVFEILLLCAKKREIIDDYGLHYYEYLFNSMGEKLMEEFDFNGGI